MRWFCFCHRIATVLVAFKCPDIFPKGKMHYALFFFFSKKLFILLVSADQVVNENGDFQSGQVDSRTHTRSTTKSKEAERPQDCLQLIQGIIYHCMVGKKLNRMLINGMEGAYIKSGGIELLRIWENFRIMVNRNNIQVNRPSFLDLVS